MRARKRILRSFYEEVDAVDIAVTERADDFISLATDFPLKG